MHFNTNDEVNYISTNLKKQNYEKKAEESVLVFQKTLYLYAQR